MGGLTAKDFTDQRNDAMREGVKVLFLMNGGGSIALLAFLQAVWTTDRLLAQVVIRGLCFLLGGVVLASVVHLFRVHTANDTQRYLISRGQGASKEALTGVERSIRIYEFLYFGAAYLSVVCFVVGIILLVSGASCILRYGCLP